MRFDATGAEFCAHAHLSQPGFWLILAPRLLPVIAGDCSVQVNGSLPDLRVQFVRQA
jgi:hypothetical protein